MIEGRCRVAGDKGRCTRCTWVQLLWRARTWTYRESSRGGGGAPGGPGGRGGSLFLLPPGRRGQRRGGRGPRPGQRRGRQGGRRPGVRGRRGAVVWCLWFWCLWSTTAALLERSLEPPAVRDSSGSTPDDLPSRGQVSLLLKTNSHALFKIDLTNYNMCCGSFL